MNYLFDLDDTIYYQDQPFIDTYELMFADRFSLDPGKLFIQFRVHSEETFARSEKNEISMEDMYVYRIGEAFKDLGVEITREEALEFQYTYANLQHQLRLNDGMRRILDYCKDHDIFVSLITNGPWEHQRQKINSLGLGEWIDLDKILISSEVGFRKPGREIYDMAVERFNLDLNETYFVGDSFDNDIAGAHNAGWKSIWFNHRHRTADYDYTADYEVFSYDELLQLIKTL